MEKEFTLNLAQMRKKKKVTRRDVSIATGITEATLGNYENNKTIPSLRNADLLAAYYGCTVDALLGRTEDSGVGR